MNRAKELLCMETGRVARKVKIVSVLFPFLKKRIGLFAERIYDSTHDAEYVVIGNRARSGFSAHFYDKYNVKE